MGSLEKRGLAWRAYVAKKGIRKTATFDSKLEALKWIENEEKRIVSGKSIIAGKTFGDLLDKYAEEVSSTKRGKRWEEIRIELVKRHKIASIPLESFGSTDVSQWRNDRLKEVSSATVRREWNLLSHACSIAVKEWKWLEENPFSTVKKPASPDSRDRLLAQSEIDSLLHALGYDPETEPATLSARVGAMMLFALETGMRLGEICAIRAGDVNLEKRFLRVTGIAHGAGKTRAARRDVPLSTEAVRILSQVGLEFGLKPSQVDALFRKAKKKALVEDLHFHDTRHHAITNLARKLNVLELARMVGHQDLRQLNIYYNETAEELARRLD